MLSPQRVSSAVLPSWRKRDAARQRRLVAEVELAGRRQPLVLHREHRDRALRAVGDQRQRAVGRDRAPASRPRRPSAICTILGGEAGEVDHAHPVVRPRCRAARRDRPWSRRSRSPSSRPAPPTTAVGGPTTLPGTGMVALIFGGSSADVDHRHRIRRHGRGGGEVAVRVERRVPVIHRDDDVGARRDRQGDREQRGHHDGPAPGASHFHHRFLPLPSALRLK